MFSFFHCWNEKTNSVGGILNSVAYQKRLMLDFLIDNCTLHLTPTSNQSSPVTLPSSSSSSASIPSISTPIPCVTKIYSCLNKCGQSYESLSSLQQHMRLECSPQSQPNRIPIAKKFECIYCNEMFTQRDKLKSHIHDKHRSIVEWCIIYNNWLFFFNQIEFIFVKIF